MAIFACENDICYDIVLNWEIFNIIYAKRPISVLELASGPGYVLSRLEKQLNIPTLGFELNNNFLLFRTNNNTIKFDFMREKWPIKDKEFDLAHTTLVLDSIKNEYKEHVFSELQRTCRRGLHIVKNKDTKYNLDKSHEIVGQDILEVLKVYPPPHMEAATKLHLAPGKGMYNFSWHNLDTGDYEEVAKKNGFTYKNISKLTNEELANLHMPNTCIGSYSMYLLDSLTEADILYFLEYSWQKLIPGAAIRLGFLNYNKLIKYLFNNTLPSTIYSFLTDNKKNACTHKSAEQLLKDSNFTRIEICEFNKTNYNCFKREIFDTLPDFYDFIEARKLTA